jgi:REP element-mobilizing transposase RayT
MVHASHVVFCAYGFWLPNDPRGSWSDFVGSWELLRFGRTTKTPPAETAPRRSAAYDFHDREARLAAKEKLKYPPVEFTGAQARAIGNAFAKARERSRVTIWGCSILPEHVHMVIARHDIPVEQIVNLLKGEATRQLVNEGIHPLAAHVGADSTPPKMCSQGLWKVFLDSPEAVAAAVRYVQDNPAKEGLPEQKWRFVTQYEGGAVSRNTRSPLARG